MTTPALTVTVDKQDIARVRRMTAGVTNALPRIMTRAINKTAAGARAQLTRAIRAARPGLKSGAIRKAIGVRKAGRGRESAMLSVSGKRIPLIEMSPSPATPEQDLARGLRRGVSYRQAKGGRKRLPHAFIARMSAGGRLGVYERKGKARFPVRYLRGPSVGLILAEDPQMLRKVELTAAERLGVEIKRQTELVLKRAKKA